MNDKWMKDLRRLGDQYRQTPPEGLLGDIKRVMVARGLEPALAETHAKAVPLWRRVAVAAAIAVLLGVGTIGYLTYDGDPKPVASAGSGGEKAMASAAGKAPQTMPAPRPDIAPDALLQSESQVQRAPRGLGDRVVAAAAGAKEVLGLKVAGHADNESEPLVAQTGSDTREVSANENRRTPVSSTTRQPATTRRSHVAASSFGSSRRSPWGIGMYYGGQPSMQTSVRDGGNTIMSLPASDCKYSTKLSQDDAQRLAVANVPPIVHEKHHRPIKVGVSLEYRLSDHWSLQSGITYSRLTSDLTEESPSAVRTTRQKLHYIGIPVSLSYSVWQTPHLNVYVKGGGGIEQLVKGESVTQRVSETSSEPRKTTSVSEHRPVFSTHAAAGVEYQPAKLVSFFAEPGAEFYFKNGSGIKSSYTDKPLNFNLNVGVRMKLDTRVGR